MNLNNAKISNALVFLPVMFAVFSAICDFQMIDILYLSVVFIAIIKYYLKK